MCQRIKQNYVIQHGCASSAVVKTALAVYFKSLYRDVYRLFYAWHIPPQLH